jgi:hypothetical protein
MQSFSEEPGRPQSALGRAETDVEFVKAVRGRLQAGEAEAVSAQMGPRNNPRFRIFVIDTGWNSVARRVLQENLALIRDFSEEELVYFLDRDQSVALLRQHCGLIGHDPIISVHDMRAMHRRAVHHVHGFRLHLGMLRREGQALHALQMFARFLRMHRAAKDLDKVVRQTLHKQGLKGAIEIMGGAGYKHLTEE